MKRTGIIGLGQWGKNIISQAQGKNKKPRIVGAWNRASEKIADFRANQQIGVRNDFENILDENSADALVIGGPDTSMQRTRVGLRA